MDILNSYSKFNNEKYLNSEETDKVKLSKYNDS